MAVLTGFLVDGGVHGYLPFLTVVGKKLPKNLHNSVVFRMDLATTGSSCCLSRLRFAFQNWLPEITTGTCKKYGSPEIKKIAIV